MAVKKTRTGKKLTPEGKVAVPSVKLDPETKKLRATTAEEKTAARTTILPPVMPKGGPKGIAFPNKTAGVKGLGAKPNTRGFSAGSYPKVKAAVEAARTHLTTMGQYPVGTPEHQHAAEAFHLIHANIGQLHPQIHTLLGQAKHFVTNPGGQNGELLNETHKAIDSTLDVARRAQEDNIRRANEGRVKKAGNNGS